MNQHHAHCATCAIVGLLSALAGGCALTSKAEPVNIRYFDPEASATSRSRAGHDDSAMWTSPISLRLGRVQSGHHLRERSIYQSSVHELGYHEDLRWLERPEVYAERAVKRALFERRANKHVLGAGAPTLEIEVSAFQEVRSSQRHYAYVRLEARIIEANEVTWRRTIDVRAPVVGSNMEDVVAALGVALEDAAESLAQGVSAALSERQATDALAPTRASSRTNAFVPASAKHR